MPQDLDYANLGINISKLASMPIYVGPGCNTPSVNTWPIYNITGRDLWEFPLYKKNKRESRREREETGQAFETTNTPTRWANKSGSAPE